MKTNRPISKWMLSPAVISCRVMKTRPFPLLIAFPQRLEIRFVSKNENKGKTSWAGSHPVRQIFELIQNTASIYGQYILIKQEMMITITRYFYFILRLESKSDPCK